MHVLCIVICACQKYICVRYICMPEIYACEKYISMLEIYVKSRNFWEIWDFRSTSRMFILAKVFQIFQIFRIFSPFFFTQIEWELVVADTIFWGLSNLPSVDLFDDMDPMLLPSTVPSDQDQLIPISKPGGNSNGISKSL